jgi:hypothetical protein
VNTPELFIIGAIVTAIVTLALGLVLYGAIMDGRSPAGLMDDPGPVPPDAAESGRERPPGPTA